MNNLKYVQFSVQNKVSAITVIRVLENLNYKILGQLSLKSDIQVIRVGLNTKSIIIDPIIRIDCQTVFIKGGNLNNNINLITKTIQLALQNLSKDTPKNIPRFSHHNTYPSKIFGKISSENDFIDSIKSTSHHTHIDIDFFASIQGSWKINKKHKFKEMQITRTKKLKINGVTREITIVVLNEGNKLKAGYSVRIPSDKNIEGLSEKIALGRANKPNTNLVDMELGRGMDKKFILYAIADNLLFKIEKGIIGVKGIRKNKK